MTGRFNPAYPLTRIDVSGVFRHDLGDLDPLADSMADLGLLTPLVVTRDGLLICGTRRIAAARQLGWATVPVWIPDQVSEQLRLFAMRDDHALRLQLNPLEQAALYIEYRRLYADQARLRQEATRFGARPPGAQPLGRQLPARSLAAFQVTGSQSFQRLDRIVDLQHLARDGGQHPQVGWEAAQALAEISLGGPVTPAWTRVTLLAAVTALQRAAADPAEPGPVRDAATQALAILNQTAPPDVLAAALAAVRQVDAVRAATPQTPAPPPDPTAGIRRRITQVKLRVIREHGWWNRHDPAAFASHATPDQHNRLAALADHATRYAQTAP